MIEAITRKFSGEPKPASVGDCPGCGGDAWWLPRNQSEWRCENCSPPPSEIFVAQRRGAARHCEDPREPALIREPEIITSIVVTCCQPWCDRCGGWQGKEAAWNDGSTETTCRTCGAEMPDWPAMIESTRDE